MEQFIDQVSSQIPASRRRRDTIARELRSHYEEACRELEETGLPSDEAAREGLVRLGDPEEIARDFERVYRPSRRSQISLAFVLAGALILGMFSIGDSLASANVGHHHLTHQARVKR